VDFDTISEQLHATSIPDAKFKTSTAICPKCNNGTLNFTQLPTKIGFVCTTGCSRASIETAISSLTPGVNGIGKSPDAVPPAGESSTPTGSPASSNGHANGNGKVHHPDEDIDNEIDRDASVRSWKRRLAKIARGLLRLDDEYKKPHLTPEMILDPLVADLRRAMTLPEHIAPGWLSAVEIKEELESVARWAIDEHFKHQKEHADKELGGEDEEEEQEPLKPLGLGALYDLVDEWDRQPWIWDQILPQSSLSLIVGKSETGKSTLIYRLIYAIVRGEDFLGRRCEKGRVLYLAGDPVSEVVAGKTLKQLGLERTDDVRVVPGALVAQKNGMAYLRQWMADFKPCLVVGDTLAATVPIDVDKYGQSYQVQQPLTRLARDFKANFLMSHHSQKSAIDTYSVIDSALGSVGVAAVASTRMGTKMYTRKGKRFYTFAMSNSRIGAGMEGEWIVCLREDGHIELDGQWGKRLAAMDREEIIKVLKRQDEPLSGRGLIDKIFPRPKWTSFREALEKLVEEGDVIEAPRKQKGGGKVYSLKPENPSA
jgi:hypothetical protein